MRKVVFWFRRDLRFNDNTGLLAALAEEEAVLPVFIFDERIINELDADDPRISFIYKTLKGLNIELKKHGSGLLVLKGDPLEVWKQLLEKHKISKVFSNKDYEPYARERDRKVEQLLQKSSIGFYQFKDQVIFEEGEVVKDNKEPYHVFTPYKNKWLRQFIPKFERRTINFKRFLKQQQSFPSLESLGFSFSEKEVKDFNLSVAVDYGRDRDFPAKNGGTFLGPHLRFGTISIRETVASLWSISEVLVSELIWREFFMQILYHYPKVVHQNFKPKYDGVKWINDPVDFENWCKGQTGFPMVDAGMRELNTTGYMHNRVRMITAGFLCKHLLIDWRWGEAYFASKLLDYELSSNNGNWQWAAGTGCDAAPYFRIFNPSEQLKKFDKDLVYVRKWIPEFDSPEYPEPMIDHKYARERALKTYKEGIK
ncbi:deoxyribodipyrimidine photo-lyase [Lutimonas vermicola]|uniref:Deoxyribodipyrimidine photo-lyase n=1 Tax=Lutimonas vermicola TaxID=414288 RepID=A0ABU9L3K9_9FLAO